MFHLHESFVQEHVTEKLEKNLHPVGLVPTTWVTNHVGLEVERAQIFWARTELELRMSGPNEPEPVKIALEPASSPSFLLIKMLKFEFQPTSSLLEN